MSGEHMADNQSSQTHMPAADVLTSALRDFKRSVEITRDVRFQANLRLLRRHRASAYIVSILSTYVIALSLIPNVFNLAHFQNQVIFGCSIVLSVFVIFTSLIDGSQNFFHQGELLHQCVRKIATIHIVLKTVKPHGDVNSAKARMDELQRRYQAALDECPINHDNVDYHRELANKPHLFPDQYAGKWRWGFEKWNRFLSVFLSLSWMTLHLFALGSVSFIVYVAIFSGAHSVLK